MYRHFQILSILLYNMLKPSTLRFLNKITQDEDAMDKEMGKSRDDLGILLCKMLLVYNITYTDPYRVNYQIYINIHGFLLLH